ncbi:hypothetical protein D1872_274270 [compost metagenome]
MEMKPVEGAAVFARFEPVMVAVRQQQQRFPRPQLPAFLFLPNKQGPLLHQKQVEYAEIFPVRMLVSSGVDRMAAFQKIGSGRGRNMNDIGGFDHRASPPWFV